VYGNELDRTTSPLAAGLDRFVKLDGEDFTGRAALLHEREHGTPRRLVGLEMRGPGIARHGYSVVHADSTVGVVTSGTHSPTLEQAIALAYVASGLTEPGTELAVDVGGRAVPAIVVPTPFYRRPRPVVAVAAAPGPAPLPETTAPPEPPPPDASAATPPPEVSPMLDAAPPHAAAA